MTASDEKRTGGRSALTPRRRGALARICMALTYAGYTNYDVRLYRLGGFWPAADVTMERDGVRYRSNHAASTWHRLANVYEDVFIHTYNEMAGASGRKLPDTSLDETEGELIPMRFSSHYQAVFNVTAGDHTLRPLTERQHATWWQWRDRIFRWRVNGRRRP